MRIVKDLSPRYCETQALRATHPDIPHHPSPPLHNYLSSTIHFTSTPDISPYTLPHVIPEVPADPPSRKSPLLPTTTPPRVQLSTPDLPTEGGSNVRGHPAAAAHDAGRPEALPPSPPPHVSPCMRPLWRTLPSERGGSRDRITVVRRGVPASAWSRAAASVWRLVSGGFSAE
jgi:hypothetical protein